MSFWKDINKEDISMDNNGEEIHVLYNTDDQGNYYISLKTADILETLKEGGVL